MDRISDLPDLVLCHIISFLPMKSAIKTSVLAKRWRYLWTSITHLEFKQGDKQGDQQFVRMVNQFLQLHRGPKIKKFQLRFYVGKNYSLDIEKWLQFANMKRVEELDLNLLGKSLEFHILRSSSFKGLSSLKTLCLANTKINEDVIQTIISECPLLENFDIKQCHGLRHLNISALDLQLRSFTVVECPDLAMVEIYSPYLIQFEYHGRPGIRQFEYHGSPGILTPSSFNGLSSLRRLFLANASLGEDLIQTIISNCPFLESLSMRECGGLRYLNVSAPDLHLRNLTLLNCPGVIEICAPDLIYFEYHVNSTSNVQRNLLIRISHVKVLVLSASVVKSIYDYNIPPARFEDVKELQIHNRNSTKFKFAILVYFLAKFPRLEKLYIDVNLVRDPSFFESYEMESSLVFYHLKTIKMEFFSGVQKEMKLVRFLLEKATVLETLSVALPPYIAQKGSSKGLSMIHEQLLLLPRASTHVKIVLT